jgi:hypothetical protein
MATSVAKKPLPGVKKRTFYELLFTINKRAKLYIHKKSHVAYATWEQT